MKNLDFFSIDYKFEFQEELFSRIINSAEFQRLKGVSFLGFMAKNFNTRKDYSRFEHSLGVAFLAKNLANRLNLDDDEARLFILASFLHDIGHMPFSHASEEVFSKISRMNHYRRTIDMIKGRKLLKTGGEQENVAAIIKDFNIHPEEIINLYNGKSQFPFLNELWKNPINLDTIDAINRCAYSFKTENINPLHVIDYIQRNEKGNLFIDVKDIEKLDKFWNLKDFIYTQFIYGKKNIILESMLNQALFTYFKGKKSNISKYNLFTDDKMIEYLKKKSTSREIFDKLE
ncbi:MAG: HD domain-containing protein, partial [Candidatus Hodarchaeota archaeon]